MSVDGCGSVCTGGACVVVALLRGIVYRLFGCREFAEANIGVGRFWIVKVLYYLCYGIQVEILNLSEIGSLFVYQGLDFFFVQVVCFSLRYPVEPLGIVFGEYTTYVIHLNTVSALVEMYSHEELLATVLDTDNDVLGIVAVFEHRYRVIHVLDKVSHRRNIKRVVFLLRFFCKSCRRHLYRHIGESCRQQNFAGSSQLVYMPFG